MIIITIIIIIITSIIILLLLLIIINILLLLLLLLLLIVAPQQAPEAALGDVVEHDRRGRRQKLEDLSVPQHPDVLGRTATTPQVHLVCAVQPTPPPFDKGLIDTTVVCGKRSGQYELLWTPCQTGAGIFRGLFWGSPGVQQTRLLGALCCPRPSCPVRLRSLIALEEEEEHHLHVYIYIYIHT